jgi:hypothetical protein
MFKLNRIGCLFQKIGLLVLFPFVLAGCEEKITYSYLMHHPGELQKAILACQSSSDRMLEQERQCEVVMAAGNNMFAVVTEQQADPEKFGQRIMDAELAYAEANDELQKAIQILSDLQNKKASSLDLASAKEKVDQAKKAVEEKQEELNIMLAVLSLSSPE